MGNGEISEETTRNENDGLWDSVADVPFKTWADEVEDKKVKRKEALDSYRAASEAFRMDFNERATGPEQFAEWIASEENGISEEEIEFEGKKIKVYHLTGHEFLALVHSIDYRKSSSYAGSSLSKAHEKSRAIRNNPNNWATMPTENNPRNVDNGLGKSDLASNVSTSLASDKAPFGYWVDDRDSVYYGFSNLGHRRIITAGYGDRGVHQGWASNIENEEDVRTIQTIDEIEKNFKVGNGNEVAIDRYEEDSGQPILPDFIYCPELPTYSTDELADDQKRHAAYFNIPIVILHRDAYDKYQG